MVLMRLTIDNSIQLRVEISVGTAPIKYPLTKANFGRTAITGKEKSPLEEVEDDDEEEEDELEDDDLLFPPPPI